MISGGVCPWRNLHQQSGSSALSLRDPPCHPCRSNCIIHNPSWYTCQAASEAAEPLRLDCKIISLALNFNLLVYQSGSVLVTQTCRSSLREYKLLIDLKVF